MPISSSRRRPSRSITNCGGATAARGRRSSRPAPVQFVDVFPNTADGKIHLVPPALDREAPGGLYAFRPNPQEAQGTLTLLSPATHRTISSSLGPLDDTRARGA